MVVLLLLLVLFPDGFFTLWPRADFWDQLILWEFNQSIIQPLVYSSPYIYATVWYDTTVSSVPHYYYGSNIRKTTASPYAQLWENYSIRTFLFRTMRRYTSTMREKKSTHRVVFSKLSIRTGCSFSDIWPIIIMWNWGNVCVVSNCYVNIRAAVYERLYELRCRIF